MKGSYIKVQALTWEKDTHGLFDYEAKCLHKSFFKIFSPCCIYRSNGICYIPATEVLEDSTPLIKFDQKSSEFRAFLMPEDSSEKM